MEIENAMEIEHAHPDALVCYQPETLANLSAQKLIKTGIDGDWIDKNYTKALPCQNTIINALPFDSLSDLEIFSKWLSVGKFKTQRNDLSLSLSTRIGVMRQFKKGIEDEETRPFVTNMIMRYNTDNKLVSFLAQERKELSCLMAEYAIRRKNFDDACSQLLLLLKPLPKDIADNEMLKAIFPFDKVIDFIVDDMTSTDFEKRIDTFLIHLKTQDAYSFDSGILGNVSYTDFNDFVGWYNGIMLMQISNDEFRNKLSTVCSQMGYTEKTVPKFTVDERRYLVQIADYDKTRFDKKKCHINLHQQLKPLFSPREAFLHRTPNTKVFESARNYVESIQDQIVFTDSM